MENEVLEKAASADKVSTRPKVEIDDTRDDAIKTYGLSSKDNLFTVQHHHLLSSSHHLFYFIQLHQSFNRSKAVYIN